MLSWEAKAKELTPVEEIQGMYFKREDKFAPKGPGDINGSKLRQCLHLVEGWVRDENILGVVSGAVKNSPQHIFISEICKYYGLGCVIYTGAKAGNDSEYLRKAETNGAHIFRSKVGYAKTLQSKAFKAISVLPRHKLLETNITLQESTNSLRKITEFHMVGARQTQNIPEGIKRVIIPAGSCNSATSILLGLILNPVASVEEIVLMGIGNYGSKDIGYIDRRLQKICKELNIDAEGYYGFEARAAKVKITHLNLNGSGFCSYEDTMPEEIAGVKFHPRYEGKCIRYIKKYGMDLWNRESLFWIVGSDIK